MSDAQAKAKAIVDKFKMDTRHSNYTVIEGDDADQLIADITAALDAREREVWEKVRRYQLMRIALSDQSRCVEVFAGNIVKEAIENGAIAELRGLETWINEERSK